MGIIFPFVKNCCIAHVQYFTRKIFSLLISVMKPAGIHAMGVRVVALTRVGVLVVALGGEVVEGVGGGGALVAARVLLGRGARRPRASLRQAALGTRPEKN
jgi:hypothetical protein